jgi:hypothetical protein
MLAYLFWHSPRPGVPRDEYERLLIDFHAGLALEGVTTAAFRLERLPFAPRSGAQTGGYEDWYLVEDWAALGELAGMATGSAHSPRHGAVGELSGEGWGAVYALMRGTARPPAGVRWLEKPRAQPLEAFLAHEPAESVWRRQLVLGPAAELCLAAEASVGRERL